MADRQRQQRAVTRRRLGRLTNLIIAKRTGERYDRAVAFFFDWVERQGLTFTITSQVVSLTSAWVEECWEEGESIGLAADTVSGLQHLVPELKGLLKESWRLFKAWRMHELPARAPPLLKTMVQAMAMSEIKVGNWRRALLLLIGFNVFLRTGEILKLRVADFIFDRKGETVVLQLGMTKSGKRRGTPESVVCRSPELVTFAKLVLEGLPPGEPVFNGLQHHFRTWFAAALDAQGLSNMGFRPYSLRRGGATAAFREGASWESLCEIGSWASQKTLRIYVTDALAELAELRTPPLVWATMEKRSAHLSALLQG